MKDQKNLSQVESLMNEFVVEFVEENGGWEKMNLSEKELRELLLVWVEREGDDSLGDAFHYGDLCSHLLWDKDFKNNAEDALQYAYDCV